MVAPWEEEGATLPSRHHSKESPAAAKGEASLVRRGSDPTLLTSSKVGGSPSSSGAVKKVPSGATKTLMQAVGELPGTPAGISPRSSLSAYPDANAGHFLLL